MIRGFYTGASSMIARTRQMAVIGNNLANVNTSGFKKDMVAFKALPEYVARRVEDNVVVFPIGSSDVRPVVGKLGTGVELNEVYNQKSQSGLKLTENPLDLALDGKGFFVVDTPQGERYTRNGSFTINHKNELVTQDGHLVMGENGKIIMKDKDIRVDKNGKVRNNTDLEAMPGTANPVIPDGEVLDRLKIVRFEFPRYLRKEGNSFFKTTKESGEPVLARNLNFRAGEELMPAKVVQGGVETSNVNPVQEMVKMIEVQRAYEAAQKTITSGDQLLNRLINNMASV